MVPTTERQQDCGRDIGGFYDWLATDYDRMTGFEKRFVHEKPFFRLLVERYRLRTAVDAGCGTGFHSLLLAQLGVSVTAVDISTGMLRAVRHHVQEAELPVTVLESSFADLPKNLDRPIDAVFCLGNSLAHLLSKDDLRNALRSFAAVLRPGGILFLQNLNYDRILATRERVQSVKEEGDVTYTRFYDYEGELIRFNILRQTKGKGDANLKSVLLRPILQQELSTLLTEVGFQCPRVFGGIAMQEFKLETSKDLVILSSR